MLERRGRAVLEEGSAGTKVVRWEPRSVLWGELEIRPQVGRVGPGKESGLQSKSQRKTLVDFEQVGILWSDLSLLKCAWFQTTS